MKLKPLLSLFLWAFIAASVAVLLWREWSRSQVAGSTAVESPSSQTTQAPRTPAANGGAGTEQPENSATSTEEKKVVYCFHATVRCDTCRKLENYTREALQLAFPDKLADGSLELRVVDVEQPQHAHFRDDFLLIGPSLVVARLRDGKTADWSNLSEAVSLLRDKLQFVGYVQLRVKTFLETPPSEPAP